MYIILCVIDQPERLRPLLHAWKQNNITGVTIMESTGMHRLSEHTHVPMRYLFGSSAPERGNITLFTVVEDEETIQRCLEVTESIIGNFNEPNTGIFISWPLSFAKGVITKHSR